MTDHDILRLMGQRIREARLKANLTQECLAELVGVHWKTVGCIEQGRYPFAITTFARLVRQLEASPNQLLKGLAEPDRKQSEQVKKALARKRKRPTNRATDRKLLLGTESRLRRGVNSFLCFTAKASPQWIQFPYVLHHQQFRQQ